MTHTLVRLLLPVLLTVAATSAYSQSFLERQGLALLDEQTRMEQEEFARRAEALRDNISRGWTAASVQQVMGMPDSRRSYREGNDDVEIWGYSGFDVRIEMRNGVVHEWFFRFQP